MNKILYIAVTCFILVIPIFHACESNSVSVKKNNIPTDSLFDIKAIRIFNSELTENPVLREVFYFNHNCLTAITSVKSFAQPFLADSFRVYDTDKARNLLVKFSQVPVLHDEDEKSSDFTLNNTTDTVTNYFNLLPCDLIKPKKISINGVTISDKLNLHGLIQQNSDLNQISFLHKWAKNSNVTREANKQRISLMFEETSATILKGFSMAHDRKLNEISMIVEGEKLIEMAICLDSSYTETTVFQYYNGILTSMDVLFTFKSDTLHKYHRIIEIVR